MARTRRFDTHPFGCISSWLQKRKDFAVRLSRLHGISGLFWLPFNTYLRVVRIHFTDSYNSSWTKLSSLIFSLSLIRWCSLNINVNGCLPSITLKNLTVLLYLMMLTCFIIVANCAIIFQLPSGIRSIRYPDLPKQTWVAKNRTILVPTFTLDRRLFKRGYVYDVEREKL